MWLLTNNYHTYLIKRSKSPFNLFFVLSNYLINKFEYLIIALPVPSITEALRTRQSSFPGNKY